MRDEAVLIRDDQGRPWRWYGIVVDVTERRLAEEALRDAETRYRTLIEQLPVVVAVRPLDPQEPLRYVSDQFASLFGYTAADIEANPKLWLDITHPDDLAGVANATARAAEGSGRLQIEYRQRTRDGRWLWVQEDSVLLRDRDGGPRGWQTVLTDVTRLKLAQEAAEMANALKSTFLSSMSHELRTPLNAITGYAHLLLDGYEGALATGQRTSIETIAAASDHLLALIDDVLDLSRIEAEALELVPESLAVSEVVERVRSTLANQAAAKGLALTTDVAPDVMVEADRIRLRQILLNLVGNAIKFTEQGSVDVSVQQGAAAVEIAVSDTGCGIAAEFLPHVFDEFRQADPSTTRRHGGSGLGLAIVRRLVELHGGTIGVESVVGRGTTFVVTLPLADSLNDDR